MSRSYLQSDLKLLFGKSGLYCAFPECGVRLLAPATAEAEEALLAFIAHIVGHSDVGPRADKAMALKDRDRYANLVLLCGHHHTLVDAQDSEYTVEQLQGWKRNIESWVEERLGEGMRDIRFAELQVVCDALIKGGGTLSSTALVAVPPADKMAANELTDLSSYRMQLGLMQAPQVADFLERFASQFDSSFPERLRRGFVAEYDRLKQAGVSGDALFLALHDFASEAPVGPSTSLDDRFTYKAAALAVLCHLFQVCDVFEPPKT